MKLDRARIVIRERSLGETLDLVPSFLVSLDPKLISRLALLTLLPAYALCLAAQLRGLEWGWVWVLAVACGAPLQGVFTVAAGRVLFSDEVSARAVLRQFGARLVSYAGTLCCSGGLLALSALTVVLLPFAWTRVAFVHEAALLENASVRAALRRANRMMWDRTPFALQMVGALLVGQFAVIMVTELLAQSAVGFVLQLGQPFGSLFEQGGSPYALAGYFLSLPVVSTARFLTYIEQRTRQDGWDVQVRFMGIRGEAQGRIA